jgi:uncharacterized protein YceK
MKTVLVAFFVLLSGCATTTTDSCTSRSGYYTPVKHNDQTYMFWNSRCTQWRTFK